MKQRVGATEYLFPSTLGVGLVDGYNTIGLENSLSKPNLRRLVSPSRGILSRPVLLRPSGRCRPSIA